MTLDEYKRAVMVIAVPEAEEHSDRPGWLVGRTRFWVRSDGLHGFDRPALELRDVPALFVGDACDVINYWGHYSVRQEIKASETIGRLAQPRVVMRAEPSEDPWYSERDRLALRLEPHLVEGACSCCGEGKGSL